MSGRTGASKMLAIVACLALLGASPVWAEVCANEEEQQALRMRMLQTDLMVAALSCQQHDLYNAFVTRFKPALGDEGKMLKAFFKRTYKGNATGELDDFVTRLANESSLRGMKDLRQFCKQADVLFQSLMTIELVDVGDFLASWPDADRHGMDVCLQQAAIP